MIWVLVTLPVVFCSLHFTGMGPQDENEGVAEGQKPGSPIAWDEDWGQWQQGLLPISSSTSHSKQLGSVILLLPTVSAYPGGHCSNSHQWSSSITQCKYTLARDIISPVSEALSVWANFPWIYPKHSWPPVLGLLKGRIVVLHDWLLFLLFQVEKVKELLPQCSYHMNFTPTRCDFQATLVKSCYRIIRNVSLFIATAKDQPYQAFPCCSLGTGSTEAAVNVMAFRGLWSRKGTATLS